MSPLFCLLILTGLAATAIGAIAFTVVPYAGRIADVLFGRPQRTGIETRREHWRRVHLAADRARVISQGEQA